MKSLLLYGLITGLVYAIAMSAFEVYADGEEFSLAKFMIHFILFGGIMSLTQYYMERKRKKE